KVLEIALAGDSWWGWVRRKLASREDQEFCRQVQAFLDAHLLAGLPGEEAAFRRRCLEQLRSARDRGLLSDGALDPAELARSAGEFGRFGGPASALSREWQILEDAGQLLAYHPGHQDLARLVSLPCQGSTSLLATAVRYFFRRAVEDDDALHRGLAWAS